MSSSRDTGCSAYTTELCCFAVSVRDWRGSSAAVARKSITAGPDNITTTTTIVIWLLAIVVRVRTATVATAGPAAKVCRSLWRPGVGSLDLRPERRISRRLHAAATAAGRTSRNKNSFPPLSCWIACPVPFRQLFSKGNSIIANIYHFPVKLKVSSFDENINMYTYYVCACVRSIILKH